MNTILEIADTAIPDGITGIVSQLPSLNTLKAEDTTVTLRFNDRYVYQTGLVLLATWRKSLPSHVKVVVDDSECQEATKRLLTNSGFRELVETNMEAPSCIHYYPGRVPIQPIVQGYSTEQTISQICKVFEGAVGQLDMQAFRVLLSELCENTYAHSEFETPGYISAHLHSDKCEIAISDSGIGIRNSYLQGTNDEAKKRIIRGDSAIELAVNGLSSSKPKPSPGMMKSYYGYGLFIVRRLMEENRGRLTIVSDTECVNVERYQKRLIPMDRAWNGTFVGLLIDVSKPLPLDQIYQEAVERLVPAKTPPTSASLSAPAQAFSEVVLSAYGSQLLTREIGTAIRADIATVLSSGAGVKVILDGIEDLTPSVADECFGKLAESMGEERFRNNIILAGGQPIALRLIELVVRNRLRKK